MAVVLDTDDLPAEDRAEAVVSAMHDSSITSYISSEGQDGIAQARMDVWAFGTASVLRSALSGIQLARTAKQVRTCPSPNLVISVQEIGAARWQQHGEQRVIAPRQLLVTDENSPYEFSWAGRGASQCLFVSLDDLGLPHELISDAGTRLHTSRGYRRRRFTSKARHSSARRFSSDNDVRPRRWQS